MSQTTEKTKSGVLGLSFLGLLAAIQGADPNINSTALLTASTDLKMGSTAALAASISTLLVAATVISTGMLADRLGRRKVLIVALLTSAAGDLLVASAASSVQFLAGRALAGIGLGAVYGCSFAYVKHFATGKGGIAAALGTFAATMGVSAVTLTFIGGSLVGIDWRVAFLLIPIASLISIGLSLVLLPKDGPRPTDQGTWDVVGQLLLGLGVIVFLYGVSHATHGLTELLTVGPVIVGLLLLVAFYLYERHQGDRGFFPVRLFSEPIFIAAIILGLIYNLTSGATLLSFTNLFQYQLGFSGLTLAASQLPYMIASVLGALVIGRLAGAGKISTQLTAFLGALMCAGGGVFFALVAISRPTSLVPYLGPLVIMGVGIITSSIPYGGLILREADPKHYGVVSSSRTTIGQFWYSLGLAASTVTIDTLTRGKVNEALGAKAVEQVEAYSVSGTKPTDPDVLKVATDAFASGFGVMMLGLAIVNIVAGIIVYVLIKRNPEAAPQAA